MSVTMREESRDASSSLGMIDMEVVSVMYSFKTLSASNDTVVRAIIRHLNYSAEQKDDKTDRK